MKKAVFLDRDGTINWEVDNLKSQSQLKLLPLAANGIRLFNKNDFFVVVITNQPVVARGHLTEDNLLALHDELKKRLKKKGANIDAIYYCPHHPNANIAKYRKDCPDRKPNLGLIKKAIAEHKISLKDSFFVGDSTTDLQTAKNAKIKSILVQTGYGGADKRYAVKPGLIVDNLYQAAKLICRP